MKKDLRKQIDFKIEGSLVYKRAKTTTELCSDYNKTVDMMIDIKEDIVKRGLNKERFTLKMEILLRLIKIMKATSVIDIEMNFSNEEKEFCKTNNIPTNYSEVLCENVFEQLERMILDYLNSIEKKYEEKDFTYFLSIINEIGKETRKLKKILIENEKDKIKKLEKFNEENRDEVEKLKDMAKKTVLEDLMKIIGGIKNEM